jgi:hypothetical protein
MQPSTFVPQGPLGVIGAREPGKPPFVWQRDIGNCLPMLMKNAAILTQNIYNEDEQALIVLDTITRVTAKLYEDSRKNHIANAGNMYALLNYVQHADKGMEVYSTFCQFLMLSIFAYLFGCKEMTVALPDKMDADCYDFNIFMDMFMMLPEDKRKDYLQEIRKHNCISAKLDLSKFYRAADDYITKIKEDQAKVLNG